MRSPSKHNLVCFVSSLLYQSSPASERATRASHRTSHICLSRTARGDQNPGICPQWPARDSRWPPRSAHDARARQLVSPCASQQVREPWPYCARPQHRGRGPHFWHGERVPSYTLLAIALGVGRRRRHACLTQKVDADPSAGRALARRRPPAHESTTLAPHHRAYAHHPLSPCAADGSCAVRACVATGHTGVRSTVSAIDSRAHR